MNTFNANPSAPYPTLERPSKYVVDVPQPQHQQPPLESSQPVQEPQRPYPIAPLSHLQQFHSNASTDSITTRLQNAHITRPQQTPVAQNPAAMGSITSFQSSLDEATPRQGSVSSAGVPVKMSPLEQAHAAFVTVKDRALTEQGFTPSVQLAFVKSLLENASNDAFLLRYDINGVEWDHMLTSSEVKKNQHGFVKHAVKLLKKVATEAKDPEGQFVLASLYSHSPVIKVPKRDLLDKNYEKARDLYARAGSRGHPMALYRLGVSCELGVGGAVDEPRALDCFQKSAQKGCIPAMFRLGMVYSRGGLTAPRSPQMMMHWFQEAAKGASKENPHALFELAKVYERDMSLTNSPQDQQFIRELDSMGVRYDEAQSLYYYKEAARLTYAPSQFKLGWCYEYGKLQCPIDAKKSIGWYSRAAKQGHPAAEMALSGWYLTGAKGVLSPNDREAFLWATKAAETGFVKAEYALGYYYEVGLGCDKDLEMAKKYYLRAATQGHEKSRERLRQMRG